MLATKVQKRSAVSSNPLLDPCVLQNVLSYVGPGHCLFVATINSWWKDIYFTLEGQLMTLRNESGSKSKITCVPQMTLYSSVFTSPSRVKLARESGLDCTSRPFAFAAGKHADVLALATAHEVGMQYTATTKYGAARCNKLAEVQHLRSQGCPWHPKMLEHAAKRGHFGLLRWCHEHGCPWDTKSAPEHAVLSCNVELMAWVLQQPGAVVTDRLMSRAAFEGCAAMCQYLHSRECPWSKFATYQAANAGHVDVLTWLINNGCPWDIYNLCNAAIYGGSIEVLEHLQEQGMLSAAGLTEFLDFAGMCHQLKVMKWLRQQGAEWPVAFEHCPWKGNVLAWARAEGCTTPATALPL
jgi:hypothetical protein